jgi:enoyl-CoA hydratase/carnithine racemase
LRPRVEIFAKALDRLEQLPIPTIAGVQGGRMGGGFELALSCDMIIAERSARFAFPEAQLGILTLQGGMIRIAEHMGRAKAAELVFLSEPVDAEDMAAWTVVNRVVKDGDLDKEIWTLVARLAAGPAKAYAATKSVWRLWAEQGAGCAKAALYDISMPLFDAEDVQKALRDAAEAIDSGKPLPTAIFTAYWLRVFCFAN